MGWANIPFSAAILSSVLLLASCAEKFPRDIPENYAVPHEYTFSVPFEKAWQEVVKTVSGRHRLLSVDKGNGVIVTEFAEIAGTNGAGKEGGSAFGRTYKNSYIVKVAEAGKGKTAISIKAHLKEEYFSLYDRECPAESFAAYLRQELFRGICADLYENPAKCLALFPTHNAAVCLPSAPPPSSAKEDDISHPNLDPMWKLEINVRELQKALARAGYDPGPIDGLMGRKTRAALIRFQKDNKLEASGKLDESTMIALEI